MGLCDFYIKRLITREPRKQEWASGEPPHTEKAVPLTRLWYFLPEHFEICAGEEGGAEHDSPAMLLGKASSG